MNTYGTDFDFAGCCEELQCELTEAKGSLDIINDSLKKFVGRPRDIGAGKSLSTDDLKAGCQKYLNEGKQKRSYEGKSVFRRLSIPNERNKPTISSRIIRELPSREQVLEAQCSDSESRARNRRMFGSLLGTLHKFCQEESRLKIKEEKRALIEKKLEDQQLLERETLRKERDLLLMDRQIKHSKIKSLEWKLNRMKDFAVLEKSVTNSKNCIRTKTKPFIYFCPSQLSKKTEKLLSCTRDTLHAEIKKRRLALNLELKELELDSEPDTFPKDDFKTNDFRSESCNFTSVKSHVIQANMNHMLALYLRLGGK
ncbi:unnamed protein product [Ceratitis capitata]|uniref:(Mediterranean fruit fly) hypothetical protein n=1 Tax=Ceratitis capitata TaxID=7213 RepID=A0A811UA50_CERCA|nr:unnamed protein product [Ceratitis capitata]